MEEIRNLEPRPLKKIIFLTFFQLILSFLYFIISYFLSKDYFSNFYEPYEHGLKIFCNQYTGFGTSTVLNIESEYNKLHYESQEEDIEEINKTFKKILKKSLYDAQKTANFFINSKADLNFQRKYKNMTLKNIDSINYMIKNISYLDFVLQTISRLNENIQYFEDKNSSDINYDNVIFLQRNYPYYLSTSRAFYDESKNEFLYSGEYLLEKIMKMLIVFLVVGIFVKIVEIKYWYAFETMLKQILFIFQRCKEPEINRTLNDCNEVLKKINNSDEYFHTYFSEEILEKILMKETDDCDSSPKKAKKDKNYRKKEQKGDREFSHLLAYFFITFVFIFLLFYYSFIYISFDQNNQRLQALNQLDFLFMDLNVFSTSIVALFNLALREMIVVNPNYEESKESFQMKDARLNYFLTELDSSLDFLLKITSTSLLTAQLDAKEKLPDNAILEQIIKEDLCQILIEIKEFDNDSYENRICKSILNGVFRNGLINTQSEFIRIIKLQKLEFFDGINNMNENQKEFLKERIKAKISDESCHEILFATYYIHILEDYLYENIDEYYTLILYDLTSNLENYLELLITIVIGLSVLLAICINIFIKHRFKSLSFIISLIPYERLISDEQLVFLIKSFLKNHG